jgi:hypothetical protein
VTASGDSRREVVCAYGHPFRTAAAPGGTVRCPRVLEVGDARPEGRQDGEKCGVGVYLAKFSPAEAAPEGYWDRQPEVRRWLDDLGAEEGQCPTCGGPLRWLGNHTALICPAHATALWVRPPGAIARVRAVLEAELAAHRKAAGAEVARRGPTAAEARAARVQLGARKDIARSLLDACLAECDPSRFPGSYDSDAASAAAQMGAYLRQYAAEITHAESEADLAEILAEIRKFTEGGLGSAAPNGITYPQLAIRRRQAERRQEERARLAAEEAEAERAAAERAEAERARSAPRALTSGTSLSGLFDPRTATGQLLANSARANAQRLAANGPCAWCDSGILAQAARRIYGLEVYDQYGDIDTVIRTEGPIVARCCGKKAHRKAAEEWMAANTGGQPWGYTEV